MHKFIILFSAILFIGCDSDIRMHNAKGEQWCENNNGLYNWSVLSASNAYIKFICRDGKIGFLSSSEYKEITGELVTKSLESTGSTITIKGRGQ